MQTFGQNFQWGKMSAFLSKPHDNSISGPRIDEMIPFCNTAHQLKDLIGETRALHATAEPTARLT